MREAVTVRARRAAHLAPSSSRHEGDAVPSSGRSRAVALRALAAGRDVEYLGWCYDVEPGSPPLCAHAYALSQRLAKVQVSIRATANFDQQISRGGRKF